MVRIVTLVKMEWGKLQVIGRLWNSVVLDYRVAPTESAPYGLLTWSDVLIRMIELHAAQGDAGAGQIWQGVSVYVV